MRLPFLAAAAAGFAACLSSSAGAAPGGAYSRAYESCMASGDAAQGITSGIMDCTGEEIDRQDARLNQAYVMVMRRLPPARKAALREAERRWIRARDARCRKQAASEGGGSLAGILYNECILGETVERRLWLERYR